MNIESLRLLAVTESPALAEMIENALRNIGPCVLTTRGDAQECVRELQEEGPAYDVILLDDAVRGEAGASPAAGGVGLDALRMSCPLSEIILFNGRGDDSTREALRQGAIYCPRGAGGAVDLEAALSQAVEHHQLRGVLREKQTLERLAETSIALLGCKDRGEVFDCGLRAVSNIGFERGRLYIASDEGNTLILKAQFGMARDFIGLRWAGPESGQPDSWREFEPTVRKAGDGSARTLEEPLGEEGCDEYACVPLRTRGGARGLIIADCKPSGRAITKAEVRALVLVATQIAAAVENRCLHEDTRKRAEQLEALRQTTLGIAAAQDSQTLLHTIIKYAVELLGAKNGGIYKYYATHGELKVVADYLRPGHVGRTVRLGEGMAGRLVQDGEAYKIVDDYQRWGGQAPAFIDGCPYGAVLEVPLKRQGQITGVIYVDDALGRKFTAADARLLDLFADQAAIALGNAELLSKDEETLLRLKKLSTAIKDIMGNLGTTSLEERLNLIARRAAGLLEAEACGVFLVRREGFLRLEASFGHRKGGFARGKELPIRSAPGSGLTGHIAHEGKLFFAHGEALVNHVAVSGKAPGHLRSGRCDSIVALPLMKKVGGHKKLVGLIRVDNKEDKAGRALPTLKFTPTDRWMLHIFAKAVVFALESAELVERLERLVESSPNGVIATDEAGHVTLFNESASAILGYAAEEVMGKHIEMLYDDPDEARVIGKRLHLSASVPAKGGRLTNCVTKAKSKTQQLIPIRLSATWLHDSRGERTGSAGYFEDLRPELEAEKSLGLLLEASQLVANAKNYSEGLQNLARKVSSWLPHTFCRILLLDETGSRLTVEAACATVDDHCGQKIAPGIREPIKLADWPGLYDQLASGEPRVLRGGNPDRGVLKKLSDLLRLQTVIPALLLVPLKNEDRVVGMLEFGELPGQDATPFPDWQIQYASTIAANTAALINRMRLHDQTAKRGELLRDIHDKLTTLYRISQFVQSASDLKRILNAVLTGVTADFGLRFNRAGILLFDREAGVLEGRMAIGNFSHEAAFTDWSRINDSGMDGLNHYLDWAGQDPIPLTPVGERMMELRVKVGGGPDDVFARIMRERRATQLTQEELDALPPEFLAAFEPALPCVVIPVEARDAPLGLLIADNKFTQAPITEDDLHLLSTLASSAAAAVENIELLEKTRAALTVKERLYSAAIEMAGVLNSENVGQSFVKLMLDTIIREARDMFDADACTIWPVEKGKFMPKEMMGVGIADEDLKHFREIEPTPEGTTHTILKRGWVCVPDVSDKSNPEHAFIKDAVRRRLLDIGIQSFRGLTLKVGAEPVGVLYVSYARPRPCREEERRALEDFATWASPFISTARLLDLIKTINSLAKVVAEVTALEHRDKHLPSIADRTREAIGCDALVLYAYDKIKNKWKYPPSHSGVHYHEEAWPNDAVPPTSIVYSMLQQQEPYVAERVFTDPLLKGRRFVSREGIKSCAAFPLRAEGDEVGVMFINYRDQHRFTPEELSNIALFAHQAALAIHNAQLYEEKLNEQKALMSLSQTLLDTFDIGQTLSGAVNVAISVLPADLCDIVLADERGGLTISATAGRDGEAAGNYPMRDGAEAHAAYVMSQTDVVCVENYAEEVRFEVPPSVRASAVTSGMSVRIDRGGRAVGALRIHTRRPRRFTQAEANLLSLIACQTAVAIGSAEHRAELSGAQEKLAQQSTMEWMGVAGSAWAHDVTIKALVFKENAESLLRLVGSEGFGERLNSERRRVAGKLKLIREQAQEILDMPITTPLSIQQVRVNDFLRERVLKLSEQRAEGVEVEWSLSLPDTVCVEVSPEWFSRAVLDVVVINAFEAMSGAEHSKLTVSTCATAGNRVEIRIADTGPGIPEGLRGRLFAGPITNSRKGNGIGLFLAGKVMETFSGHIGLAEPRPQGAAFVISLPAIEDAGE